MLRIRTKRLLLPRGSLYADMINVRLSLKGVMVSVVSLPLQHVHEGRLSTKDTTEGFLVKNPPKKATVDTKNIQVRSLLDNMAIAKIYPATAVQTMHFCPLHFCSDAFQNSTCFNKIWEISLCMHLLAFILEIDF